VRVDGKEVTYLSADAVSLNDLTVGMAGPDVHIRDTAVAGGMDPGPCRPGETSPDGYVIEVFCRAAGVALVRIDLGEREDKATLALPIATALLGGGGADQLTAGDPDDAVIGGDGNDVLAGGGGKDEVAGGQGEDTLRGDAGDDTLDGGPDADTVEAGPGADRVKARDGVADHVACGEGADRVEADQLDIVEADCEQVERAEVAPPTGGTTTAGDTTPPRVVATAAHRQRAGRRLYLSAASTELGFVSASGFLEVRGVLLPLLSNRLRVRRPGAAVELTVRFSRSQRRAVSRALRRGRRVRVRMHVVATDLAGNSAQARAPLIRLLR